MELPNAKYISPFGGQGAYRFGFNGKEKDRDIDKYDFGARLYDDKMGRWMSVDPLENKYPNLNPYNFVANNPINNIDIKGDSIYFVKSGKIYKIRQDGKGIYSSQFGYPAVRHILIRRLFKICNFEAVS
jgi:RHS repeat-associated protein